MNAPAAKCAALYCLFGLSTAVFKGLAMSESGAAAPWFVAYFGSVLLVALALACSHMTKIMALLAANKTLAVLMAYMLLSSLWALDPGLSAMTAVRYGVSALFGLYLAARFSPDEMLALLCAVLAAIMLCSIIMSVFLPQYGQISDGGPNSGAWQGAFTSRNGFAIFMNLAFAAFAVAAMRLPATRALCIGFAVGAAALVGLSRSATGLIVLSLIASAPLLLPILRYHGALIAASGAALFCMVGLLALLMGGLPSFDFVFEALGKDPTLTNRTATWDGIMHVLTDFRTSHVIHGYGAQDVYLTSRGEMITERYEDSYGPDNTYLNVLLKFGLIGSAMFAVLLAKATRIAVERLNEGISPMRHVYVVIILILYVNGLTESVERMTFLWVWFAVILASDRHREGSVRYA